MSNIQKTIRLPISKFIDTRFRDYSLYVLSSRGIPSFYDALTPVQRYILMNAPTSFSKTLTLVGKSIESGYSHGDASLQSAISKLARPFGAGNQILEGYGFFGTEVTPEPAAARYTSVKINNRINEIIKKYKHLITKEKEGPYDPLWLDIPIGLTTTIVGIAVGYKTTILPRKLEDIQKYLEGEIKSIKPYFMDFNGKVKKYKGLDKAWIITSNINIEGNRIKIRGIPPILKYKTVLKKIDHLITRYESKIRIINNSNTKVTIDIVYIGKKTDEWEDIQKYVEKIFSVIVTENPVFIKDSQVLVYDSIEQYLDDYRWQLLRLKYYNTLYERDHLKKEITFNEAKKEFIIFVLQKRRTIAEIDLFLKPYEENVQKRLEGMTSKKFTKNELEDTKNELIKLKKELRFKEKELIKNEKSFNKAKDPTEKRGVSSKNTSSINLFDTEDIDEVNGIYVWDGEDPYEENINNEEQND